MKPLPFISNSRPEPQNSKSTFALPRMAIPTRQSIALISEHGDPAADIGHEEAGGQNVYVRKVGEALAKLGWQVDMFTRKVRPEDPTIVHHGPHCRTIRLKAGPETFIPRDHLFEHMPEFVDSFLKFQAKDGGNYPLVHTNYWMSGWVGLQLKQVSNIQLVHTYHSLGVVKYQALEHQPPIAQTRLLTEKQLLEQANCVVATSPQEQDYLRSLVSREGYIEVIPCGADLETFRVLPRQEARASLGFRPDEKVVLYVGRFDPRKGIETLVRAFAELRDQTDETLSGKLRLAIVGGAQAGQPDDQERARIEALVDELGLTDQTLFIGQVGHDRLPWYYTAADVCVIPSHYEPFGLVAVEAMACGTPVIASNVGGLKFTVIPGETGLLVNPQDVSGFAIALEQVLSGPQWATQIRHQAANWVQQNFSWAGETGVAAQLSDLYRRLFADWLQGSHPRPVATPISVPKKIRLSA
ncbi:MAG: glycosyltransferase family 1 protein [Thermosynechococcaceae cyanobacterium]